MNKDRREKILSNLARHIFRYGFASLTMEGAAAAAHVSKRTLYAHFPGKDALLDAVLEFQAGRIGSVFSTIANDESLDTVAKLSSVISLIAEIARRLPPVLMRDMMSDDRHFWDKVQKIRQERIFSVIQGIILNSGKADLIRKDIQAPLLTTLLFASIEAVAMPSFLLTLPFEPREVLEGLLSMLFQGILSESGRAQIAGAKRVAPFELLEDIL